MSLFGFNNDPKTPKEEEKTIDVFFEHVRRVATSLVLGSIILSLIYAVIYVSKAGIGDDWSAFFIRWIGITCGIVGTVGLLLYISLRARDMLDAYRDSDVPKRNWEVAFAFFLVLLAIGVGLISKMPMSQTEQGYFGTVAHDSFWIGICALVGASFCIVLRFFPRVKRWFGRLCENVRRQCTRLWRRWIS